MVEPVRQSVRSRSWDCPVTAKYTSAKERSNSSLSEQNKRSQVRPYANFCMGKSSSLSFSFPFLKIASCLKDSPIYTLHKECTLHIVFPPLCDFFFLLPVDFYHTSNQIDG